MSPQLIAIKSNAAKAAVSARLNHGELVRAASASIGARPVARIAIDTRRIVMLIDRTRDIVLNMILITDVGMTSERHHA